MYVCGPTVQSAPHIGHLRSALVYDQMRRWFMCSGFQVTLVRNVTDIDDKVLARATETLPWWALASKTEREFEEAYSALGILAPTVCPRATGHIGEMITLIQKLISRGYAYRTETGNVYFHTVAWKTYGELTAQQTGVSEEENPQEEDAQIRAEKRDPRDFALWKAHRESEPADAGWESPFGYGRPGWHIECSAMAKRYLGEHFDIHGGGLDLRFPHHENELAQSKAAGFPFANFWVHNGLVHIHGQKMSKSLGNSLFAADLLQQASPLTIRYFLGSAHYRSLLDFSETSLQEASAALERIRSCLQRLEREREISFDPRTSFERVDMPEEFCAHMDNDFALPNALAVLHTTVRHIHSLLDKQAPHEQLHARARELAAMLYALHLNPQHPDFVEQSTANSRELAALDALVQHVIDERKQARAERDFARADALRNELNSIGIVLEDTPQGTHWSINDGCKA